MTQDNPLMEHSIVCPKCGSNQVEKRNHEQNLQKLAEYCSGRPEQQPELSAGPPPVPL